MVSLHSIKTMTQKMVPGISVIDLIRLLFGGIETLILESEKQLNTLDVAYWVISVGANETVALRMISTVRP
jgi:hypothetical protein